MERPPRDAKKDHLVNWKLILHAYLLVGGRESGRESGRERGGGAGEERRRAGEEVDGVRREKCSHC